MPKAKAIILSVLGALAALLAAFFWGRRQGVTRTKEAIAEDSRAIQEAWSQRDRQVEGRAEAAKRAIRAQTEKRLSAETGLDQELREAWGRLDDWD